jgi:hypothetical protein
MAVTHDMAHSFDVVDALPVKTDEGANLIEPQHGTDKRHGVASRRKYAPPWPLVDVVIPRRYHPFAGAQNNTGSGITRAADSAFGAPTTQMTTLKCRYVQS